MSETDAAVRLLEEAFAIEHGHEKALQMEKEKYLKRDMNLLEHYWRLKRLLWAGEVPKW